MSKDIIWIEEGFRILFLGRSSILSMQLELLGAKQVSGHQSRGMHQTHSPVLNIKALVSCQAPNPQSWISTKWPLPCTLD